MERVTRRGLVLGGVAVSAALFAAREANATLVRGLTLPAMVARTHHAVVVVALDSHSHEVQIAGRRTIVTDTRVRIEEVVAKRPPKDGEVIIRTLGGRIGNVGEIVHGQPELALGVSSLAFLKPGTDGAHWIVGMAQGHYPLKGAPPEQALLTASRNLPTIRDWQGSAVRALVGQSVSAARLLVLKAIAQ